MGGDCMPLSAIPASERRANRRRLHDHDRISPMNGIDGSRQEDLPMPRLRQALHVLAAGRALPGAKVKCYYCGTEIEDRSRAAPPLAAAAPRRPPAPASA